MPRRTVPKYRCFKPRNLGLVVLDGKQHYLGPYGTPESLAEYHRLVQEWLGRQAAAPVGPRDRTSPPTVDEVILAFWTRHAEAHYRRPDGTPSGELANYRDSLRPLRRLYGATFAADFSPLKLKDLRHAMVDSGLSRGTINQRVGRVVRVFKWAASEELVAASVYDGLKTVSGLSRGRTAARETDAVKPVADDQVDAVRPHVSRQVWAMIQLQRLTGMRPGEVVVMRGCDLDRSGDVWVYTPASHKTAHHGRSRQVFLGRRGQDVLRAWLRTDPSEYLFSPRESMREFRARQRRERKTPLPPSQRGRPAEPAPSRRLGARYTTQSYHHAVGYGCRKAGVAAWHPNRLRHSAATSFRKAYGLDVTRAILGHSSAAVTEVYAELDRGKASRVAAEVG